MNKNPVANALGAASYIFVVVSLMNFVTRPLRDKPDTFFAPISALFVLTLSAAVMAYLFFYQPILLLIEGKKIEAVNFFVKTVGIFGAVTGLVLFLLYLGVV
ncbi:hypothetical protein A2572_03225 [Candidatus Collierbacteria bacterium RIFOXYD1_FULL_40_9]|uniref:Uncharacterized protein n=1 Tax=Candidatus Collierbacteria bacterium RIFOXYD1_FULL_40_9 TaxID=1817731 RepID=A0A1F5FWY5_9BACT|nr:MAG: hypothetical protein A2572_03225 [Candidatus Collierbacteria bacterium RIFOXYD1_FULL_40_9]